MKQLTEPQAWRAIAKELLTTQSLGICSCGCGEENSGLCAIVVRFSRRGHIDDRVRRRMSNRIFSHLPHGGWAYGPGGFVNERAMAAQWLSYEAEAEGL